MGRLQREQPKVKVCVRPALMIRTATAARAAVTLPENAPQTHADPAIQVVKRGAVAVLEIPKPALRATVDVGDDRQQSPSIGTVRLRPDRVPELPQALRARPTPVTLEVIPQEVETL